jgi:hypothetical protein
MPKTPNDMSAEAVERRAVVSKVQKEADAKRQAAVAAKPPKPVIAKKGSDPANQCLVSGLRPGANWPRGLVKPSSLTASSS